MNTQLLVPLAIGVIAAISLASPWTLWPIVLRSLRSNTLTTKHRDTRGVLVSVVVPARNEADCIRDKVLNTLAQAGWDGQLELLIGDDASSDGTREVAHQVADDRVRIIRNPARRGKVATLERLVDAARGQIIVFSDASAHLEDGAIAALVKALGTAGAAGIRYAVGTPEADAPEASWWRGQTRLRAQEAPRDALLGLHGACWAAWRELVPHVPHDTINDDYVLPLLIRAGGERIAYIPHVAAWDTPTDSRRTQRARWRRIARGNVQMLWRYRRLLLPTRGRVAANLWLQKAARTFGVLFLGAIAGAAVGTVGALVAYLPDPALPFAVGGLAWALLVLGGAVGLSGRARQKLSYAFDAQWSYLRGIAAGLQVEIFTRTPTIGWERADAVPEGRTSVPASVRIAKRSLDIVAATIGLVLGAPLAVLVAIAIKLDSRGPVIHSQERVCASPGVDGPVERTFVMHKFRTMTVDAETASGPTWAVDNDPRITRVGRFLRKARLDELPQLWDVLRGAMSLVGPRPERPFFTAQLMEEIPGYKERLCAAKPGITGWAQVRCPYDTSLDSVRTKVLYDMAYCAHMYRFTDWARMEAQIIRETVVVALTGKGAK